MDSLIVTGAVGAIALIAGGAIGFWVATRRAKAQAAKAQDIQQRFDDYRQQVTAHFGRTAEHFQAIGKQYKELYEHMAGGAETLFELPAADRELGLAPGTALGKKAEDDEPDSEPPESEGAEEALAKPESNADESEAETAAQRGADPEKTEAAAEQSKK